MKKVMLWFLLLSKRLWKHPSFLCMLLTMPLIVCSLRFLSSSNSSSLQVAIYNEDRENFSAQIVKNLLERQSSIHFYEVTNREELYHDVKNQRVECAYIFPKDFTRRLENENTDGLLSLITSPGTLSDKLINEVVYSEIYRSYAPKLLLSYCLSTDVFAVWDKQKLQSLIEELYERFLSNGSTFSFQYSDSRFGETSAKAENYNYLVTPVRGIIALFILMAGMAGTLLWYQDSQNGLFLSSPYRMQSFLNIIEITTAVLPAAIIGLICLKMAGIFLGVLPEFSYMFLYMLFIIGFCNLLRLLLKKASYFCSAIPILALGTIIICPVFVDFSMFLPFFRHLRKLFAVNYYLKAFAGQKNVRQLLLLAIATLFISFLFDIKRNAQK